MATSKRDLIDDLRGAHTNLTRKQATQIVNDVFSSIAATLRNGDTVRLAGFGSFVVRERKARTGRNIKTGEAIAIPARKVVRFKPAKAFQATATKPKKAKKG
ncbi:MAG: HU family DNA-binding protein [Polyangiales bacterium]